MTITEFLEARIAEDEALANAANAWASHGGPTQWIGQPGDGLVVRLGAGGPHIASWSPARVLVECAAKRAIVALHGDMNADFASEDVPSICETCHDYHQHCPADWPCPTLRALAAVYADHEDYRQVWSVA